ncbi:MAG: 50S ribosomal protein L19 [Bacilli bacterium]|nr:50S ribosomal protein L19 [Bacilli bacterium]
MNKLIEKINKEQIRTDLPELRVGYTVKVGVRITEGKKERIQYFEGIITNMTNGSVSKTFTVRRKVGSVGVERVFPLNSPAIDTITVVKKGKVRRANLTFLRGMLKDYKTKERK